MVVSQLPRFPAVCEAPIPMPPIIARLYATSMNVLCFFPDSNQKRRLFICLSQPYLSVPLLASRGSTSNSFLALQELLLRYCSANCGCPGALNTVSYRNVSLLDTSYLELKVESVLRLLYFIWYSVRYLEGIYQLSKFMNLSVSCSHKTLGEL